MKKIFLKVKSLVNSLGFSFFISWKSSNIYFILRALFEVTGGLLPIATIYMSKEIINSLVGFTISTADINLKIYLFAKLLIVLLLIQIFERVVKKLNEVCTSIHKDMVNNYINIQINKKLSTLDITFYDSPKFYNELINARRDSQALQTLTWFAVGLIRLIIQLIATIFILAKLYWLFPLIIILLNVPSILVEKKFTSTIYRWSRGSAPEERKMSYIQSILTFREYAKDIRFFDLFDEMINRYNLTWKKWFSDKKSLTFKRGKWATITSAVPNLGLMIVNLYVGVRIITSKLTLGDYSFYSGISSQVTGSIYEIIANISMIYDNELRISHYRDFLSWKETLLPCGSENVKEMPLIEFRNVSFKYPNTNKYILKNISFKMQPGEKIALVGLNGAGKSTIIKLLLRFYDVSEGQILFDGINIRDYNIKQIRKVFGVLFQDFSNYAFSARENIALSDLDNINDETRIARACHISGADKVIDKFESGLDTYLTKNFDEKGQELSGGEWQKIALARAFFRNNDIIILDEPTSALDPEAEHKVFELISDLYKNKGAIFISHRLSSVIMSDRILVLEDGKIIENGSHNELIQLQGRYAYLFNLQAEKYAI